MPIRNVRMKWGNEGQSGDGYFQNHKPRCQRSDKEPLGICNEIAGFACKESADCDSTPAVAVAVDVNQKYCGGTKEGKTCTSNTDCGLYCGGLSFACNVDSDCMYCGGNPGVGETIKCSVNADCATQPDGLQYCVEGDCRVRAGNECKVIPPPPVVAAPTGCKTDDEPIKNDRFGDTPQACIESYFQYNHIFTCGDSSFVAGTGLDACADNDQVACKTTKDGKPACRYRIGAQLTDNWGWCNTSNLAGAYGGDSPVCSTGNNSYQFYSGFVYILKP